MENTHVIKISMNTVHSCFHAQDAQQTDTKYEVKQYHEVTQRMHHQNLFKNLVRFVLILHNRNFVSCTYIFRNCYNNRGGKKCS